MLADVFVVVFFYCPKNPQGPYQWKDLNLYDTVLKIATVEGSEFLGLQMVWMSQTSSDHAQDKPRLDR